MHCSHQRSQLSIKRTCPKANEINNSHLIKILYYKWNWNQIITHTNHKRLFSTLFVTLSIVYYRCEMKTQKKKLQKPDNFINWNVENSNWLLIIYDSFWILCGFFPIVLIVSFFWVKTLFFFLFCKADNKVSWKYRIESINRDLVSSDSNGRRKKRKT